jgi:glycosyltransferase involved in cell wall biosynthesis
VTRRILFWVHDPKAPSFRHRLAAHIPELERAGYSCAVEVFPKRRYGLRVLERIGQLRRADILVIAKLKLEAGERGFVRRRIERIVYDFDDAVYYSKPDRIGDSPDRSSRRIRKFERTCEMADLVLAGNSELARRAAPTARRVSVVPTGIDLAPYARAGRSEGSNRPLLVWIGMAGNLPYLDLLRRPLAMLRERFPSIALRVICDRAPAGFPVPIDFVRWTESGEAAALGDGGVGVMPLSDDDWTRGKGGFKLLQYMAASLACVASPVGVNREIIDDGVNGFLAGDESGWHSALSRLIEDSELRRRMGSAGRSRVAERFERSLISARLVELFGSL